MQEGEGEIGAFYKLLGSHLVKGPGTLSKRSKYSNRKVIPCIIIR